MNNFLSSYAQLLIGYCINVQPGERVLVKSTTLAEELLKYVHDEIIKAGGSVNFELEIEGTASSFFQYANNDQLNDINPLTKYAMEHFDCYLVIRAPHNLKETLTINSEKRNQRTKALKPINDLYFERTGSGALKRSLCQFPTQASAQEAGMSLEEYQNFVYSACGLLTDSPLEYWLDIRKKQQNLVDYLHTKSHIRYVTQGTDISFSTAGRTWINSDGRNNMPSGEVFTAPVEDSVNGEITFSFPTIYRGREVENIHLIVTDGIITSWSAEKGVEVLDEVFAIEGARQFGEAAIGTNYQIDRITKNILFDEKIGGSIHMAVGQSYKQCGGKNESPIHWDMITNMKNGGQIYADGELFYENGQVILF